MASLVEDLQADALDSSVPIDDLLRKAKVVAEKLAFATWPTGLNTNCPVTGRTMNILSTGRFTASFKR